MSFRDVRHSISRGTRARIVRVLSRRLKPGRWAHDLRALADRVEERRLRDFLRDTDFAKLDVRAYPVRYIAGGEWVYQFFNMYFYQNVAANALHCLSHGWLPRVDIRTRAENANLWEQFLEQPYADAREISPEDGNEACGEVFAPLVYPKIPTREDVRLFSKLYRAPFFVLNARTRAYVDGEYAEIFGKRGNPRVCGVLCRGTDYKSARNHPRQPPVEDVIALVREKMDALRCEYIYLATEEREIQRRFDEAFPGKVLINKREYYDDYWTLAERMGGAARIAMVRHDRENDAYLRALEYLSSLVLLSRCDALIAGACGGSCAALFMNGGAYEYWHLFDLGLNP